MSGVGFAPPRRHTTLTVLTVVALAVLLQVGFIGLLAALGFTDPTEQAFSVTLRNDTSSVLMLRQCDVDCTSFHSVFQLAPGRTAAVNTSSWGADNWWMVSDENGRVLGCVDLLFDHKASGVVVDLSGYGPCPRGRRLNDREQAAARGSALAGES